MKEQIIINTDDTQADDSADDAGRVIEVNKGGVAKIHEKDVREMPSGPDVPYDVTETHSSTLDKPDADMAGEAAEHEVAMRKAKKKAGFISEDAYYNITSPVRSLD